jgi:hypothetical protein
MIMDVELARQQWEDGNRRVEETRGDLRRYRELTSRVDVLVAGLRKRVGQTFTLEELARAYDGADDWARMLLDDTDPEAPPTPTVGTLADAAFHHYARGASDYRP